MDTFPPRSSTTIDAGASETDEPNFSKFHQCLGDLLYSEKKNRAATKNNERDEQQGIEAPSMEQTRSSNSLDTEATSLLPRPFQAEFYPVHLIRLFYRVTKRLPLPNSDSKFYLTKITMIKTRIERRSSIANL